MLDCPDLAVPREVMQHVVHVESSRNPFAIGVVGGYLARQPKNLDEALAAVRQLKEEGYNFSVGISQVNRYNLAKYGLKTYAQAFETCPNLQAGSRILRECYDRAQDWGKAFSCYYSGNFSTGFEHGYVQKIFASIQKSQAGSAVAESIRVIPYANTRRKLARDDGMALGGAGAGTSVVETAESRPAIPVPGPGALKPAEHLVVKQPPSGLSQIPTQVVGVNGDPYQTRVLPSAEAARSAQPVASTADAPMPINVNRASISRSSPTHASPARKGGLLLQPAASSAKAEVLEAGRKAHIEQGKKGAASDNSFVF
jgi:type IV secretion system protein VirB1